jgi:undecaprenyl-diphosphatase
MPDWLVALILGLIEGLTEFIPVSSTGHLLIAEHWLPRQTDFFNIVIQSGAALALVPLFWKKGTTILRGLDQQENRDFLIKMIAAFILTCIGGLILKELEFELPESPVPVAVALIVGGILIYFVEARAKKHSTKAEITWTLAVAFAVGQLLAAVFPGLSRSGGTIMLAMLLGMARPAATEFSFMLGVPTLMAAGVLKGYDAYENGFENEQWDVIAWGTLSATISSFFIVRWLIRYVQSHTFNGFATYRIALGVAVLALAWIWGI